MESVGFVIATYFLVDSMVKQFLWFLEFGEKTDKRQTIFKTKHFITLYFYVLLYTVHFSKII